MQDATIYWARQVWPHQETDGRFWNRTPRLTGPSCAEAKVIINGGTAAPEADLFDSN